MPARFAFAFVLVGATLAPAAAAPITTLYSTGLGAPGSADPHYALTSAPGGFTTAFVVQQNGNFPFDAYWTSNTVTPPGAPKSGWIAPTANVNTTHPDGYYNYRTTFDLTGFDPTSAKVSGFLAADNAVKVYLNNQLVADIYAPGGYTFTTANFLKQSLSLNSGFTSGLNTLDFKVFNEVQATGNPTGFRAALSGEATPLPQAALPTPEPTTIAVFGAGLLGLAGTIRRCRRAG